jgi:hypothetical protein
MRIKVFVLWWCGERVVCRTGQVLGQNLLRVQNNTQAQSLVCMREYNSSVLRQVLVHAHVCVHAVCVCVLS